VAKRAAPIADLLRAVYADGAQAYRRAIAAQVEDRDPTAEWDAWEADTAALLLASWALGAQYSLHAAGVSIPKPTAPARFDRDIPDIGVRFKAGPAREVIRRFADLLPITRAKWDALIDNAFQAAGELRKDEANTALTKMLDRSPDLARLVLPAIGWDFHPFEAAHFVGVAAPAVSSYFLHKHYTFASLSCASAN
jgi:hypothetical protein